MSVARITGHSVTHLCERSNGQPLAHANEIESNAVLHPFRHRHRLSGNVKNGPERTLNRKPVEMEQARKMKYDVMLSE